MLLAQVHVQPRRERPAEDRVHHLERKVVGRRARHADPADADLRLRRARLVDEVDLPRRRLLDGRQLHARAAGPAAFQLPKLFSSSGITLSGVTSPTTMSVALSGRNARRVEGAQIVGR